MAFKCIALECHVKELLPMMGKMPAILFAFDFVPKA